MALAQRLNELAAANKEGRLNDDEYRILRQNLFERFAVSTAVPTEVPVIPVVVKRPLRPSASSPAFSISESATSRSPRSLNVTKLFKRRAASITSAESTREPSLSEQSSLRIFPPSSYKWANPAAKRSATSLNNVAGPSVPRSSSDSRVTSPGRPIPISPGRPIPPSPAAALPSFLSDPIHEHRPQTAREIRLEIAALETEKGKLADAFRSLELSHTRRRPPLTTTFLHASPRHDELVLPSPTLSLPAHLHAPAPAPASSVHYDPGARPPRALGSSASSVASRGAPSLRRKNSVSSIASRVNSLFSVSRLTGLRNRSNSNISNISNISDLSRSTGPPPAPGSVSRETIHESHALSEVGSPTRDAPVGLGIGVGEHPEGDVEEVWRRRAEVTRRYDQRLEYLRAKLKGAELHEKLLRK